MNFDTSQLEAIDRSVSGRNCLITGGAGTGKTTIIKKMAEEKEESCAVYEAVKPVGKAHPGLQK